MYEQRLTHRLTNYWTKINHGELPLNESFNGAAVADVWANCLHIELIPLDSNRVTYRYLTMGAALLEAYGRDMTGQQVQSRQMDFPGGRILQRLDDVIVNPVPSTDEGQFINDKNKVVKYRACLLPLGNHLKKVTHVIVGISWKAF